MCPGVIQRAWRFRQNKAVEGEFALSSWAGVLAFALRHWIFPSFQSFCCYELQYWLVLVSMIKRISCHKNSSAHPCFSREHWSIHSAELLSYLDPLCGSDFVFDSVKSLYLIRLYSSHTPPYTHLETFDYIFSCLRSLPYFSSSATLPVRLELFIKEPDNYSVLWHRNFVTHRVLVSKGHGEGGWPYVDLDKHL